jgi:hypothetical protein
VAEEKKKSRRGCLATILIIVAVLAVFTVILEYTVTAKTESLAASQLNEILKPETIPTISISMHPILVKLLMGRVDEVTVHAEGFKLKYGLNVQQATVTLKGIKVDFLSMIRTRQLTAVKSIDSGSARIVLSEEAVNQVVGARLPGATIKLQQDHFIYVDDLTTVLPGVIVNVPGIISVLPDNTLRLQPVPGEIEKLGLPQDVQEYLKGAFTVDYKVYDIPAGIELTKIKLQQGTAIIDAKVTGLDFITQGLDNGQSQ